MVRGFLGGVLAGAVASGLGLGTASVMTGNLAEPAPDAAALDVPAGSEFNQSREDRPLSAASKPDESPKIETTPEVGTSAPDDLSTIEDADMQPAAVPQTGAAQGNLSAPQIAADDAGVDFDQGDAAPSGPQPPASDVPGGGDDLSISVDPEQPAPPAADVESAAFPDTAPEAESAQMDAEADAAEPEAGVSEPEVEVSDPEISAVPGAAQPEVMTESPEPAAAPPAETPSGTIGDLAEGVATNRLPSVSDTSDEAVAEGATEDATAPAAVEDRPAIEAYAVPFENPENKPMMSIVLIDDGSSPIGLEALSSFPYPVSFAVDASWDGAAEAMRRYRDAGFEVLAMVDLPPGAQASDTEIAMQTVLAAVPESVAVLEGTESGLQSDRAAAEQLAPILLDSGHGLVLFSKGLDTARKLISREGVPTGAIFRDFDAKGQSATVIRRFLDQAAFKAGRGQEGVIMLGRLRADTISALLLWGLQDRASSVAIAPISAVLTQEP